ncbi:MAG: hypothetical protein DSY99_03620, partial [Candidatus Neomarinimicrobiota bacterium]
MLSWYDRDELNDKAEEFIATIQEEELDAKYVYNFAEAIGYTGIDDTIEHMMKEVTRNYLKEVDESLAKELSKSNREIIREAFALKKREGIEKAIEVLEKTQRDSAAVSFALGVLYRSNSQLQEAEAYYLKAEKQGNTHAFIMLGDLFRKQKQYDKAEMYYLKAGEKGNTHALIQLEKMYWQQKQYYKAKTYYLKAGEQG